MDAMESQVSGVLFSEIPPTVRLIHTLLPQVARFVLNLAAQKKKNIQKAAEDAGYSKKTAASQGSRLLKDVKVKSAYDELLSQIHQKLEISAERIRYEMACSAFFDPILIKNQDGSIKPFSEWPEVARRAMPQIDSKRIFIKTPGKDGVERITEVIDHDIRIPSKHDSLKLLGQEQKMWSPDGSDGAPMGRLVVVAGGDSGAVRPAA